MGDKLRILLAEDHHTVREGIKLLVNAQSDMEVVGEAENGEIAIQETARLLPDMVIMDVSMPVLNGLKATHRLRGQYPDIMILALTRHSDDGYLQQLIGAGVIDHVGLSRADVRAALGLEVVRLAVELERARAGNHVQELIPLRRATRERAAQAESP